MNQHAETTNRNHDLAELRKQREEARSKASDAGKPPNLVYDVGAGLVMKPARLLP